MTMTKTDAYRIATRAVQIDSCGDQYTVNGPYRDTEPRGARTERRAAHYGWAVQMRKEWVARIALTLVGYEDEGGMLENELSNDSHYRNLRARDMIDLYIERAAKLEALLADSRASA